MIRVIAIIKNYLFKNSMYLTYRVVDKKKVVAKKFRNKKEPIDEKNLDKYQLAMLYMRKRKEMRKERIFDKRIRGLRNRLRLIVKLRNSKRLSRRRFRRVLYKYVRLYGKHKPKFSFTLKQHRWILAQYNIHRKLVIIKKITGLPFSVSFLLDLISLYYSFVNSFIRKIGKLFKINPHKINWYLSNPLYKKRYYRLDTTNYTIIEESQLGDTLQDKEFKTFSSDQKDLFDIPKDPTLDYFSSLYDEIDFETTEDHIDEWDDQFTSSRRVYTGTMTFRRAFRQDIREYRRFKPWNRPWGFLVRNRMLARYFQLYIPVRLTKYTKKLLRPTWFKHDIKGYHFHGYAKMASVHKIRDFFYHRIISRFSVLYADLLYDTNGNYTYSKIKHFLTYPFFFYLNLQRDLYRFYYLKIRRVFEDLTLRFNIFLMNYSNLLYYTNPLLDKFKYTKKLLYLFYLQKNLNHPFYRFKVYLSSLPFKFTNTFLFTIIVHIIAFYKTFIKKE
jgi:hypothetical protein